jgi:hypothetical protein
MSSFGTVVLFGSGETSSVAQKVYHGLFNLLPCPLQVSILETPAGFQPNSAWVANQVADFMKEHLSNFPLDITVVPARQRGTDLSPDRAEVVAPLLKSNMIFLGAGSPTYAVRQLADSLAWQIVTGRNRLGAALVLSSAAVLAISAQTLPVYEIYKVGEALHWKPGLNFFGAFGLEVVFVPHWNNTEGGANLDTCYCFMGPARFERLLTLLPATATVVGIDEQTALTADLGAGRCRVVGAGAVTVIKAGREQRFENGSEFDLGELGEVRCPDVAQGIPPGVWETLQATPAEAPAASPVLAPPEVEALMAEREIVRHRRDWAAADRLRGQILALGWKIQDTPTGPKLTL